MSELWQDDYNADHTKAYPDLVPESCPLVCGQLGDSSDLNLQGADRYIEGGDRNRSRFAPRACSDATDAVDCKAPQLGVIRSTTPGEIGRIEDSRVKARRTRRIASALTTRRFTTVLLLIIAGSITPALHAATSWANSEIHQLLVQDPDTPSAAGLIVVTMPSDMTYVPA
jgi:hypothetical protein